MIFDGFKSSPAFYDDENFPMGFSRSGEFTIPQVEILETLGRSLIALEQGSRVAESQQEKSFTEVCKGNATAETVIERTWLKYRTLTQKDTTVTVFGRGASNEDFNQNSRSEEI